jgi:hypothetical protein
MEAKPGGEPTVAEIHAAWARLLPGLPGEVRARLLRELATEDIRPAYARRRLPPPSWVQALAKGD